MDGLPAGLIVESGASLDVDELYEFVSMVTTSEGGATIPRDFLSVMTSMPGVEPDNDMRLVRNASGALVGAEFVQHLAPHVEAFVRGFVHPDRCDEGLGSTLLSWALDRAGERVSLAPDGARVAAATVINEDHAATMALLDDAGFARSRSFLEMHRDFDGPPEGAAVPEGIELRTMRGADDLEVLYDAVDDAFRDHFGYT